ncbi:hypothetical protein G5E78_003245 [Salmonella enterica]|nr:hypothetical protein [Salmonella enterica]
MTLGIFLPLTPPRYKLQARKVKRIFSILSKDFPNQTSSDALFRAAEMRRAERLYVKQDIAPETFHKEQYEKKK